MGRKGQIPWNKGKKGQVSWMKGKHHSEEARKKMSLSRKGKPSWNKGIPMREESRIKLSKSLKGKHNSPKTQFKKGHKTWNTGRTGVYTPEQLKKMGEGHKGIPAWNRGISPSKETIEKQRRAISKTLSNPEARKKMSEAFRKAWTSPELRKQQSEAIKKYFSNPEARKRLSESLRGNKPWNKGKKGLQKAWNKGITGEKSTSWKGGLSFEPYSPEWTDVLKEMIRERDNYTCQLCGKKGYPIHHIDYNKKNCNPDNLITLCKSCHTKTNWNREKWKALFQKLNSSSGLN